MKLRKSMLNDEGILLDYIKEHYNNGENSINALTMMNNKVVEYYKIKL